ncbi:FHA domain-containing protein [Phototrophicus methaneseepsis]|uniref:FHA domain-containing protein n=1 Tax=Phototrophicus methaneseepsis TaxID=2710758 RepID=A0A7S8EA87_9CHLR|nr:FHA domain-containing protein [Phototrophicus methaneseepsis]QPC83231.1 FHA domain-containing protein [Phototrophicus methaneseepsis]
MLFRNDDSSIPDPLPNADDITRDVREHAAEALRMLQEYEAKQGSEGESGLIDNQTTYDLKEAAAQALRMKQQQTTIIQQPKPATLSEDTTEPSQKRSDLFSDAHILHLILAESEVYVVDPTGEMVIGRSDKVTDYAPDIDLTQYGAYRLGLSRRHALVRRGQNTLELVDLGSRNGTYINDQALEAEQPQRLHDGDRVRLGNLTFRVAFESRS